MVAVISAYLNHLSFKVKIVFLCSVMSFRSRLGALYFN